MTHGLLYPLRWHHRGFWKYVLLYLCVATLSVVPEVMAMEPGDPILPNSTLFVPKEERDTVERQALEGDAESALRLSLPYMMTSRMVDAIFWATIAAENGSMSGAYRLGYMLAGSPHANQRLRARFWLKKAIAGGGKAGELAALVLEEIEEAEREGKSYHPTGLPETYPKW